MNSHRMTQFLFILSLCTTNTTVGQNLYQAPSTSAGHWRSGRYIGFTPKHLRIQRPKLQGSDFPLTPSDLQPGTSTDRVSRTYFQDDDPLHPAADQAASPNANSDDHDAEIFATNAETIASCGPLRMWGRIDALLWWTKGMDIPPLVTTSPDGTSQDEAGVLGDPNTTILFGGDKVNENSRSGGRFTLGLWLDPCQTQGIDVTYAFLGKETDSFAGSNNDFTILARPFFNAETDQQDSRLIVFPDVVDGVLFVDVTTRFQTAEVLYRRAAVRSCRTWIDYYFGYRFAELEDRIAFDESTISLAGVTEGSTIDLVEQFDTQNTFNGGQLGLKMIARPTASWSAELGVKFAVGSTESRAAIAGERTSTNDAGESATTEGGLLAQQTNIGTFERSEFSTITEVTVNLRRRVQCGVTASIGYTILYWSDVNRAGDIIDLTVNPTQIPPGMLDGTARPAFAFNARDFWAQGLNFGLEYNF